jgi:hypothetical protein
MNKWDDPDEEVATTKDLYEVCIFNASANLFCGMTLQVLGYLRFWGCKEMLQTHRSSERTTNLRCSTIPISAQVIPRVLMRSVSLSLSLSADCLSVFLPDCLSSRLQELDTNALHTHTHTHTHRHSRKLGMHTRCCRTRKSVKSTTWVVRKHWISRKAWQI